MCPVASEIKISIFMREFAEKIQLYLTALDELVKLLDEDTSAGIPICKQKKRTIAKYALKNIGKPIGAVSYQISNTLPEGLKSWLPFPDEFDVLISNLLHHKTEGKNTV